MSALFRVGFLATIMLTISACDHGSVTSSQVEDSKDVADEVPVAAQQEATEMASDELDVSAITARFSAGIPRRDEVDTLISQAHSLFESGNCELAAPVIRDAAERTNTLANLISAGLEPFYSASYDDRRSFRGVDALIRYENLSNNYKRQRNELMIMEAECLLSMGDREGGVARLYKSLELVNVNERELWDRARSELYSEIGVE